MKRVIIILTLLISACSAVNEKESNAPVIMASAKPASCAFPKDFETAENVSSAIDCLQMNLDNAFQSLQGKTPGELSVAELKRLQEAGLLEFEVTDPNQWNGIAGLVSMVHPEGKDAISQNETGRFLTWLKTKSATIAKLATADKYRGNKAPLQPEFFRELTQFSKELIGFLSDKGALSLEQADSLLALAQTNRKEADLSRATQWLPAFWKLKALLLESTRAEDKIVGQSLKKFLSMAVTLAQTADKTYQWWDTNFHPRYTPDSIENEWKTGLEIAKDYFRNTHTFDLNNDELRAQVRVLMPEAELGERIPDLAKASERLLSHKGERSYGILYGLLHLFEGADQVARELRPIARYFAPCAQSENCPVLARRALTSPTLRPLTMISSQDWNRQAMAGLSGSALPRRRDNSIQWKTVLKRMLERAVIRNLFRAYDKNNDGAIPYVAKTPEDLNEATDIAYTIISLASSPIGTESKADAIPLVIKPSAVVSAVGLVADKWILPGNGNGEIDVNEFYAALKIYEDISFIAHNSTISIPAYTKDANNAQKLATQIQDTVYVERPVFIKNIGNVYERELPYLKPVFHELEKKSGGAAALLNNIVPQHSEPIWAYQIGSEKSEAKIDYLEKADTLGPVAILVLFDRLIVKCDKNEDELFSWSELQCVAPLALEAGRQVLATDILPLDKVTAGSAEMGLETLGKRGLPIALAKVVLLNGALNRNNLNATWVKFAKDNVSASTTDLARLFKEVDDRTEAELRKEISSGVIASNNSFIGAIAWVNGGTSEGNDWVKGEKGWDFLIPNMMSMGILPGLAKKFKGLSNAKAMQELWDGLENNSDYEKVAGLKQLVPMAIILGANESQTLNVFNETAGADPDKMDPISPANLLSLLEGLVAP